MREPLAKFFADRGPHLAAMIAYFALLSLVPFVFLALALLGLFGRVDEETYLVTELKRVLPSASISQIVNVISQIQENATTLGVIGGIFLLWTSLSLFSVLESALNIVYGRANRSFLHGKGVAAVVMLGTLLTLFAGLVIGTVGFQLLHDAAPGFVGNRWVAYVLSLVLSTAAVFTFLFSIYYLLPNEKLHYREVLPGAVLASVLLQVSFQALPLYVRAVPAGRGADAARARRAGDPADLALRDGERDRARRGAQLVAHRPASPGGSGRGSRACAERGRGAGPVRVRPLPVVAELGNGPLFAVR